MLSGRFGETLLAPSLVRLFGRVFTGLLINDADARQAEVTPYSPSQLERSLTSLNEKAPADPKALAGEKAQNDEKAPTLARIYGFSFEGNYYKMAAPAIFLVHGPGIKVTAGQNPIDLGVIGVEFKDEVFAEGVLMWGYDKLDQILRIDISSGWLQDMLLDPEIGSSTNVTSGDLAPRSDMVGRSVMVGRSDMIGRKRK